MSESYSRRRRGLGDEGETDKALASLLADERAFAREQGRICDGISAAHNNV